LKADGHDHAHEGKASAVAAHVAGDFLFMGKFLVLGAAVAAAMQTIGPREFLEALGGTTLLAPLAMMALAVTLSLCSEADAFVAVSFTSFDPGAQLAFLALGPVFDAKLAVVYAGAFSRRFVPGLLLISVPIILVAALAFEAFVQ
jgi:uncharacterized membrane protein YraQ (UPF0718 family)